MSTLVLDVPKVKVSEYKEVFTSFVENYSIIELKEMQSRNNLYKKLSSDDMKDQTDKMTLNETNKYLDNLF